MRDGAVLVDSGRIVAVGSSSDILNNYPDVTVISCTGVLLPALVNAHIHLELSVYGTVYPPAQDATMCDWIKELLQLRGRSSFSLKEIKDAAEKMAQDQYDSGVALMLDIGNLDLGKYDSCPAEIYTLLEMLGPGKQATEAAIKIIDELPDSQSATGHAPYSTSPELLQTLKARCTKFKQIFSIHLAENIDEGLLLSFGTGCFAAFLKQRTGADSPFPIPGIDSSAVVGYLLQLGIMDARTLCVHCVHLNDQEMKIIAKAGSHVCLCPGSNRFLSVGRPNVALLLDHGLLPALGTDSIASNPQPDMWQEMAILREDHPEVTAERILGMATLGGATALGRDADYGSLEIGKTARFLHVQSDEFLKSQNAEQLFESLVSSGRPDVIQYLHTSESCTTG